MDYDPEAAVHHLCTADPVLARIIGAVGPFALVVSDGAFRSLGQAIFFQQLAGAAARAIMNRVLAVLETDAERWFAPGAFLAISDETLRAAGLSRQKCAYLRDLATHFASGELNEDGFEHLDDEEVIGRVVAVKGIGRWTAEMFLIFSLGRPDVLPVDDLGVRRAIQVAYGLPELPRAEEMRRLAEPWRPYRSVATWYLWRSLGIAIPAE